MKIIIVASSPVKTFKETYHRNQSDYFIGIDGGSLELIARNIKPDVSIGDFDSTKDLQLIKENSYDTLFFPKQKDETDLELALKFLDTLKGSDNLEIDIYDATGARLDHELNNYLLMAKYDKYKIRILDKNNDVRYIKAGNSQKINPKNLKYFSICALDKSVISIKNALYELDKKEINRSDTYAVSNEPLNHDTAPIVEVEEGGVFLFAYYE